MMKPRSHVLLVLLVTTSILCGRAQADCSLPKAGDDSRHHLILAEGDSITAGVGATDGRGSYAARSVLANDNEIVTRAVTGATLGFPDDPDGANSLYGRMSADNRLLQTRGKGRLSVLSVLIGRNDLLGYRGGPPAYARALWVYLARMRQSGWDCVVLGTLLPSTWSDFDVWRDYLNLVMTDRIARDHDIDALVDYAAEPVIGVDEAAWDKQLYPDGTHPSNRTYDIMARLFDAKVSAMLDKARALRQQSMKTSP